MHGRLGLIVGRLHPHALLQRLAQRDGPAVLFEQIAERLVGQLLQGTHAVERQPVQRVPGLGIEGDAFATKVGVALMGELSMTVAAKRRTAVGGATELPSPHSSRGWRPGPG